MLRQCEVDVVDVSLPVPLSLLEEFRCYRDNHNQDKPICPLPDDIAIAAGYSLQVTAFSSTLFNRPSCKVASAKSRLGALRKRIEAGPHQVIEITIDEVVWNRLQSRAKDNGISELEACLLSIDYHAGLWRAKQAKEKQTPGDRFAKALVREGGRER
jgi:hypothetical protein